MSNYLITALGASAGGIQALKEFFEHTPHNGGIAYVVLLHLSPSHDSQLAHVLQQTTKMPVTQVTDKTRIEPDHVYVIPPDKHLTTEDDCIVPSVNTLMEERRAPVDIFFRSLAEAHGERAVAVVLSGTGANGSMGLKRIKEKGGAVFVQNPREAEFNEMPRNAIATDLVDDVLNVADIPGRILVYRDTLTDTHIKEKPEHRMEDQQALREIFTHLRLRTGHDFSNYKRATLMRRIERRMAIRGLTGLQDYGAFSNEHPEETQALLKDLLISVTNFFRDKTPFEALEEEILPAIFEHRTADEQVRIWVAGCATGEEAYTIAMLCAERTLGVMDAPRVQIFATDIDEAAISTGREGFYTLNDAADVSAKRLNRFFVREGEGYRIRREIREMILFAQHNFIKDPPFSRIDLVSCRNVLIYLNRTAQERIMDTFHFAIKPGGFMLLGTSESVDIANDLFKPYNREQHIYQARIVTTLRSIIVPETVPQLRMIQPAVQPADTKLTQPRMHYSDLRLQLVEQYAPPSLVVNADFDIVHMSPRAGRYLKLTGGEPTQAVLNLIRDELRAELRNGLYHAAQKGIPVSSKALHVHTDEHTEDIHVHVRPVMGEGTDTRGYLLVVFEPAIGEELAAETIAHTTDESAARHLEEELSRLRGQLRSSNEQHEFQAEELKAGNEELQAMNEELRSATEELETSKEELQSINEELSTVNQELKVKVEEAMMVGNNLQNLINSTDIGTIFLDRSMRVVFFTPAVRSFFNLIPADYARPLSDITGKLRNDTLLEDAALVLERLQTIEREMPATDGRTFLIRLSPYRTEEDRIQGVVISFVDITERKRAESALRAAEEWRKLILESAEDFAIFTIDLERRVNSWNIGAQNVFGYQDKEIIGQSGDILFTPEDRQKNDPAKEAEHALSEGRAENERWHMRKDRSRFWGSGLTHPLRDDTGNPIGFVKIMRDLTEQKRIEASKFFLAAIVESSEDSVVTVDFNRIITSWNKAAAWLYGYPAEEVLGRPMTILTLPEDLQMVLNDIDDIRRHKMVQRYDTVRIRKRGELIDLEIVLSPVKNDEGEVIGISTIARNITERKQAEETLRMNAARQAFLVKLGDALRILTDPVEIQVTASRILGEQLEVDRAYYVEINEAGGEFVVAHDWHQPGMPSHARRYSLEDWSVPWLANGETWVMKDVDTDAMLRDEQRAAYRGNHILAAINVPLIKEGRLVGAFVVNQNIPREWQPQEVELVQETAERIWGAVERARTEEALTESEEKYRTLFHSIDEGFCTIKVLFDEGGKPVDYRFLDTNPAFEKQTGLKDVAGKTMRELTPGHEQYWYDLYGRVAQTGEPADVEHPAEALERIYDVYAYRVGNPEEHKVGVLFNDITERKKAEEAQHQAHASISEILESIGDVFYALDKDFRYTYLNRKAEEAWDLTREEVLGRTLWEVFPQVTGSESAGMHLQVMKNREAVYYETISPGLQRWISVGIFPSSSGGLSVFFHDIHDRKEAEQALRISETRARTLADAIPHIIWTNTADGTANYFNQRWYEYTGLTYEQSTGVGWEAVVHPDDAPASKDRWKKALKKGVIFDTEYRLRRHDGMYRWFIGRNVPLYNEAGGIISWFGSATDIEDLKQAQELLTRSEERLRVTTESAIDYAIVSMDTERLVQGWSRGSELIFGYTEHEMTGQAADIIFTPEDRAAGAPQKEMETARDEGMAPDERWHIRRDGTRFYMSGVMRPIYNKGIISGYVKVARDMTKHKEAEEALRISEERYRAALQSAEMAAWDWDVAADRMVWNDQHYFILGLKPDSGDKDTAYFTSFVHPEDIGLVTAELQQAVAKTGIYGAEYRIIREDNKEVRWMSGYGRAVSRDEAGRATRMVGVMYDITARKRVEEQKEEFIGIASHELKTPLTSIKAYSEVLHEMFAESGDEQSAKLMDKMAGQIDRLTNLVRALLDVTRIREGKMELQKEPFELDGLVQELVQEMQLTTPIKLRTDNISPVTIHADRKGITQVIINLLSNAIKYGSGAGHIDLGIRTEQDEAVVCVRDYGIGMSPEVSEQVFERFYRAGDAGADTYPGLGLGLYISAEIVRLHGGRIWVDSQVEKGSMFCFSLPL